MLNLLLKNDIEEVDLNRPEMTAKLICILDTAIRIITLGIALLTVNQIFPDKD